MGEATHEHCAAGRHVPGPAPRRLRVRRGRPGRRLPGRARRHPPVLLAVPPGGAGQHARLRRGRSTAPERRARRRAGARGHVRRAPGRRARPGARHRAEPHGRRSRQPLVVGRARERPGEPVRRLLRHRLGGAGGQVGVHGARARARRPLRPSPRGRRAAARANRWHGGAVTTRTTSSRSRRARSTTSWPRRPGVPGRRTWASWARPSARCPPSRMLDDGVGARSDTSGRWRSRRRSSSCARRRTDVARAIDDELVAVQRRPRPARRAPAAAELPPGPLAHRRARSSTTAASSTSRPWSVCGSRTRRSSPSHARADPRARSRRHRRRAAHRPRRRPPRPRGLPRAAGRPATGGAYTVVEKILEPDESLPRLAGGGHLGLRLPRPSRTTCSSTTDNEAAMTGRLRGLHRRDRVVRARSCTRPKHQIMPSELAAEVERAHRAAGRGHRATTAAIATTPGASSARRCASSWPASPSTAPTSRRAGRRPTPDDRSHVAAAVAAAPAPATRPRRRAARLPRRAALGGDHGGAAELELGAAPPAAHRARHGQGRRGHRVLPLPPAGLAQRGRRRPGRVRPTGRRRSTSDTASDRGDLAALDADAVDARHEAQRRRAGPAQRALRDARARGADAVERWARAQRRATAGRTARPQRRVPPLPDARRRLAASTPTGRSPHGEGHPRRPRCTPRGPIPSPTTTTRSSAFVRGGPRRPGVRRRPRALPRRAPPRRARPAQLAGTDGAAAHLPGRPRPLPGHRAVGPEPGRSRQPPARRLRPPRASLLDEVRRRVERPRLAERTTSAYRSCGSSTACSHHRRAAP